MTFLYIFIGLGIFCLLMFFLGVFTKNADMSSAGGLCFTIMLLLSLIAGMIVYKSNQNDEPQRLQSSCFAEGKIWYTGGRLQYGECMTEEQVLMMKRLGQ